MIGITLQGKDYNLDLIQKATYRDEILSIRLYWNKLVFSQFVFADQGEYDTAKAAIKGAIGGTAEGDVNVTGNLTVEGNLYGLGQDGKTYRNVYNINLNDTQDGPQDEAMGIAFTRITLASGTGTGSVDFNTFVNLPAPFNQPPRVIGQYVGNVNPGTDPFSIIDVTTTAFSYDGQADAIADIIVLGVESFVG